MDTVEKSPTEASHNESEEVRDTSPERSDDFEPAKEWVNAGDLILAMFDDELVMCKGEKMLVLISGPSAELPHVFVNLPQGILPAIPHLFVRLRQGILQAKAHETDPTLQRMSGKAPFRLILKSDAVVVESSHGELTLMTGGNDSKDKRRRAGLYHDLKTGFDLVAADCIDETERIVNVTVNVGKDTDL